MGIILLTTFSAIAEEDYAMKNKSKNGIVQHAVCNNNTASCSVII